MTEPSWMLRAVTFHFGGGDAFALGLLGVALAAWAESRGLARGRVHALTLLATIWLALSATPHLEWLAAYGAGCLAWRVRSYRPAASRFGTLTTWQRVVQAASLVLALADLYEQRLPPPPPVPPRSVGVIGDSVTAGLNDDDVTWPELLRRESGLVVFDVSQQGATVRSARRQVAQLAGRGDVCVVEIGGNDVLEGRPLAEFAHDLEVVLQELSRRERPVYLVELPLPPFYNGYGRVQRRLAREYGVALIPKRRFLGVLTAAGSTVDGIHLSALGQERLCRLMRQTLGIAGTTTSAAGDD